MLFHEAVRVAKDGGMVARGGWLKDYSMVGSMVGYHFPLLEDEFINCPFLYIRNAGNVSVYTPSMTDISESDWYVVKPEQVQFTNPVSFVEYVSKCEQGVTQ